MFVYLYRRYYNLNDNNINHINTDTQEILAYANPIFNDPQDMHVNAEFDNKQINEYDTMSSIA